jgi:predicted enzyme related to lactoylglutathione lyase
MQNQHLFGHGRLSYVQIPSLDVGTSAAFYEKVFGWKDPEGDLWVATLRDPAGNAIGVWQQGPR